MPEFESFVKALRAYFAMDASSAVQEFKALSTEDKVELSALLNEAGYTHPPYAPR